MTLSFSCYLTVNVPHVHPLPEYRPKLGVSLPPKDDSKFLECALSENLPQFDFREFPHHPLDTNTPTILNGPTSRNPVDLSQVSMEAGQLVHFYLSTNQKLSIRVPADNKTEMCGNTIIHEMQFLMNDQWHVGQEIRHDIFKESFVITPSKPVWKYVGS
jgi:hypothetical protein